MQAVLERWFVEISMFITLAVGYCLVISGPEGKISGKELIGWVLMAISALLAIAHIMHGLIRIDALI